MLTVKITAAGVSSTTTPTAEDMAQLEVSPGDLLALTKAPDGAYRLTRCDDAVARQTPAPDRPFAANSPDTLPVRAPFPAGTMKFALDFPERM